MDVRRRATGLACVFLVFLVLAPNVARAVDPVEKVTALNKKALDEYKKRDYDSARALLKEALEICQSNNLDNHPIKARTHIHLGIVSIVGFKERDVGIKHFQKALQIQPDIKLTKQLATRDLQDAFEEAALAGGGDTGGGTGGGAPGDEDGNTAGQGGGATPQASEDDEGQKRPVRAKRPPPPPKKKKKVSDDEDQGDKDSGDEDDEEGGGGYKIFIGVMGGIGAGLASGSGALDPSHKLASPGFAYDTAFQIAPEIGFFLKRNLMLSLRARYQVVTGLNGKMGNGCGSDGYCSPGSSVLAGFARVSIFFGSEKFRLFVGPEIGGGYISHAVVFKTDTSCTPSPTSTQHQQCVDSMNGGPILVGAGFGFVWDVSSVFGITFSVVADAGFPDFTLNFDFQPGIALHF
jgi:hypothetical protein